MTHGGKREGAGRPEIPKDDKREVYTCRLPRWLVRKLREMPEAGKTIEAALLASDEFKRPACTQSQDSFARTKK